MTPRLHPLRVRELPHGVRRPAFGRPALRAFLDAMLRDEVEPTLTGLAVPADYRVRLLQRFANPALAHRYAQIAMDGSQKIPQRLLATLRDRLAAGAPIAQLPLALAGWPHFLRGHDEAGHLYQTLRREAQALPDARALTEQLTRFGPERGVAATLAP